jgi:hypothetical protein
LFQSTPDGFPVLRRRLHHDFLDLPFEQPSCQRAQLRAARANQHLLKRMLALDLDIGRVFHFVLGGIFYRTAWDEGICAFSWTSSS